MPDDDLRFGDVSGGGSESSSGIGDRILELFVSAFMGLIFLYVLLSVIEIMFNIPVPFV